MGQGTSSTAAVPDRETTIGPIGIKQETVRPPGADRATRIGGATLRHIVLGLFLLYCLVPALWIAAAITKNNDQIFSTFGLWIGYPPHLLENIVGLFTYQDGIFIRWIENSLLYAVTISGGSTLICAMGGYAFSKYEFPGKKFLFNFILGTIMVPSTALVLPLFLMLNQLGLCNTIWGVILPGLVNPFGLYLMKVFWDAAFPKELMEAARLEGAGEFQIFWHVGLPLLQSGLVTVALFAFVGAWNNFFLPLIVLSRSDLYPLTLGLNVWNSTVANAGARPIYSLIALGSFISVLPLLLAFVFLGRYWRGGLTAGATKG